MVYVIQSRNDLNLGLAALNPGLVYNIMLISNQVILITSKQEEGMAAGTGRLWKSAQESLMTEQFFSS